MAARRIWMFAFLVSVVCAAGPPAAAQEMRGGIRTGLVHSTLQGQLIFPSLALEGGRVRTTHQTGMQVTGVVAVPLGDRAALRAELQYAQKGAALRGEWAGTCGGPLMLCVRPSLDGTYRASYVQLPVLFGWRQSLGRSLGLRLLAGPSFGLLVDTQIVTDPSSTTALPGNALSPASHKTLGAVVGVEVAYHVSPAGAVVLGARYHPGLTGIDMLNVESNVRSRAYGVSVGYTVPL